MFLKSISLQNFRSYDKKEFDFDKRTIIIGPNTAGKTNIMEAISLLANGKSFKTDKDTQMLKFATEVGRVKGLIGTTTLEVVLTGGEVEGKKTQTKKYLVNGVPKRRLDFVGNLQAVIFSPLDLEIIIGSPGTRRNFLDEVLEQVDFDYRVAASEYEKGIRQRNSLLDLARKMGRRDIKQFEYWDNLVIKYGNVITEKREALVAYLNSQTKDVFDFAVIYDKSIISYERLLEYQEEEFLSGVTLVGPHRDDLVFEMLNNETETASNIKFFGSRGQQRLAVLQLKLLQLAFFEENPSVGSGQGKESPLLLLDDIFSELDEGHIQHVLEMLDKRDTVITTTHEEFVAQKYLDGAKVIKLSIE
ncbi:MAG TPA: DNA replication and repair protein RecF [Patescibacteria group bacterium]|nr:DNA replication and repair protein RecF [Patescibacteria group bacterium]